MVNPMQYLRKYRLTISGAALGMAGGLLYWRLVGCTAGSCPITSSPWLSALWGAVIGGLLLSMFRKEDKTENKTEK